MASKVEKLSVNPLYTWPVTTMTIPHGSFAAIDSCFPWHMMPVIGHRDHLMTGLSHRREKHGEKHRGLHSSLHVKNEDDPYVVLFGILDHGGLAIDVSTKVPREIVLVLKATILIFVVVSGEMTKRLIKIIQKRQGVKP